MAEFRKLLGQPNRTMPDGSVIVPLDLTAGSFRRTLVMFMRSISQLLALSVLLLSSAREV